MLAIRMNKSWWKILCVLLLLYAIIGGFLMQVPAREVIQESIRNLYYHVSMWFSMMILFTVSVVNAVKYLSTNNLKYDNLSRQYAVVGIVFGVLGYSTGMIWASFTWADPNNPASASFASIAKDPKLIGAAIALLIYFAYLVLRDSIEDIDKKSKNQFCVKHLCICIIVSLHLDHPKIAGKLTSWRRG